MSHSLSSVGHSLRADIPGALAWIKYAHGGGSVGGGGGSGGGSGGGGSGGSIHDRLMVTGLIKTSGLWDTGQFQPTNHFNC
jgi:hypothetical protein